MRNLKNQKKDLDMEESQDISYDDKFQRDDEDWLNQRQDDDFLKPKRRTGEPIDRDSIEQDRDNLESDIDIDILSEDEVSPKLKAKDPHDKSDSKKLSLGAAMKRASDEEDSRECD